MGNNGAMVYYERVNFVGAFRTLSFQIKQINLLTQHLCSKYKFRITSLNNEYRFTSRKRSPVKRVKLNELNEEFLHALQYNYSRCHTFKFKCSCRPRYLRILFYKSHLLSLFALFLCFITLIKYLPYCN